MRKQVDSTVEDALRTVEQTVRTLARMCGCRFCTSHGVESEKFCLLSVAISIRTMVSTVSHTARDPKLFPTIRGIQSIYWKARQDVQIGISVERKDLPFLSIALGLKLETMFGENADCYKKFDLLSHAFELFSGVHYHNRYSTENPERNGDICTAIVCRGLLYYLDCLRSINSQAETARTVHVLPGHIQMGNRQFDKIFDSTPTSEHLGAVQYNMIEEFDSTTLTEEQRLDDISIEALAMEKSTDRELVFFYKISIPKEPTVLVRPGRLAHTVLQRTGLIVCKGTQCNKQLAFPCALIHQGWRLTELQCAEIQSSSSVDFTCCVWPPMSDIARCMVIRQITGSQVLFLRRKECLACSTMSVTRAHSKQTNTGYHILC